MVGVSDELDDPDAVHIGVPTNYPAASSEHHEAQMFSFNVLVGGSKETQLVQHWLEHFSRDSDSSK